MRRRQELITWAAALLERFLIEDDYDSEFRYRGNRCPALYGSDLTGSVIYLGNLLQVGRSRDSRWLYGASGAASCCVPGSGADSILPQFRG